jgi:16S rRNA C967 or C1407 C5-methylase (RsmB/RsmF family)
MKNALPPDFLRFLEGLPGFDPAAFVDVHASGQQVTSLRINPSKFKAGDLLKSMQEKSPAMMMDPVPWAGDGYYLSSRPSFTFDPLFHAGAYYVQEASSMFLEQAIKQLTEIGTPLKVLDLCAAPGGKSTHLTVVDLSGFFIGQ